MVSARSTNEAGALNSTRVPLSVISRTCKCYTRMSITAEEPRSGHDRPMAGTCRADEGDQRQRRDETKVRRVVSDPWGANSPVERDDERSEPAGSLRVIAASENLSPDRRGIDRFENTASSFAPEFVRTRWGGGGRGNLDPS